MWLGLRSFRIEYRYLALGTLEGISTWNSRGRPRKPWKRSKVTWATCWTLVGHPISMGWRGAEIGASSCRSTRQDTMDLLKAARRNSTNDSCCWWWRLCSGPPTPPPPLEEGAVEEEPFPWPPQPPPFDIITMPVMSILLISSGLWSVWCIWSS